MTTTDCPRCHLPKMDPELIVCWPCYRATDRLCNEEPELVERWEHERQQRTKRAHTELIPVGATGAMIPVLVPDDDNTEPPPSIISRVRSALAGFVRQGYRGPSD